MSNPKKLTVSLLVTFGMKQKEIAEVCDVSEPCVVKWDTKGVIPPWHHKVLMYELQRRAKNVVNFLARNGRKV